MKNISSHHKYVAALVVLPALWWFPMLMGQLPDFMDSVTHLYPYRLQVSQQLWDFTIPLWNPYQFGGAPLAANPQIAVWYPPNWFFFLIPHPIISGCITIFHYALGGLGLYGLCRGLRCSRLTSFYAAVTFQFGSMMISRIALLPHLYTAAWIPVILLLIERSIRDRENSWRWVALVGVAYGMQLLAGSPQISYYTALLLPVYWITRGLAEGGNSLMKELGRVFLHGGVAALLAALISAIQLVPTLSLLGETTRDAVSLDKLRTQSLNDGFLWRSLVGFSGAELEDTDSINAIGFGAIIFAALAFLSRKVRVSIALLWLVGIVSWLLSVGFLSEFWAKVLPAYTSFHAPRRALIMWSIVGCVLAGLGAHWTHVHWRRKRLPQRAFVVVLGISFIGTIWIIPRLEREFCSTERFQPEPATRQAIGDDPFVVVDPTLAYAYDSRREDYGASMLPNLGAWHSARQIGGYDPLVPARLAYLARVVGRTSGVFYPSHGVFFTDPSSPLFRLYGVQNFVGRYDLMNPGAVIPGASVDIATLDESVELVADHEFWPVYRFTESRPMAWTVQGVIGTSSSQEALETALRVDVYEAGISENDIGFRSQDVSNVMSIDWRSARKVKVNLDFPTGSDTMVILAQNYSPNWKASSREFGRVDVWPMYGTVVGALVPEGSTGVTFTYAPTSFLRGALMTFAGILLSLILLVGPSRIGAMRKSANRP